MQFILHSLIRSLVIFGLGFSIVFAEMPNTTSVHQWDTWMVDADSIAALVEIPSADTRAKEVQDLVALAATRDTDTQTMVNYWNVVAAPYRWAEVLYDISKDGPPDNRPFGLMTVAMYDAVVATYKAKEAAGSWTVPMDSGVEPLAAMGHGSSFPSEHAAVAIAASEVLSHLKPDHAERFRAMAEEAMQSRLLAGVNVQSDIDAGKIIGQAVADIIIEHAKTDGSGLPWDYSSRPADTRFAVEKPIFPNLGDVKTIAIENGSQFRAPPPPAYDSDELLAQLEELRAVERNPNSMYQATYWARFYAIFKIWVDFANRLMFESGQANNTPHMAKIYAGIGVARFDAEIACFDSKYAYWFARPAHIDPNLQTILPTPPHPSYPSAHSCISSAAANTFAQLFPNAKEEALSLAEQAGQSRIFGGIHWQADNTSGLALGENIAEVVIEKLTMMTQ